MSESGVILSHDIDTAPAERSLAGLARRFLDLGEAASGARGALGRLEDFLPEDPVPPLPPRKLLKRPDARKRRRLIVRASRRANR